VDAARILRLMGRERIVNPAQANCACQCNGPATTLQGTLVSNITHLIALTSLIWHGAVSQACEKVPALAQLKKWSLGDPLMNK
jgi:hypothetical protein